MKKNQNQNQNQNQDLILSEYDENITLPPECEYFSPKIGKLFPELGSPKRKKRRTEQNNSPSLSVEKHEKENILESEYSTDTPLMLTIAPDTNDGMDGLEEAAALLLPDINQTKEDNFSEKPEEPEESEQINKLVR